MNRNVIYDFSWSEKKDKKKAGSFLLSVFGSASLPTFCSTPFRKSRGGSASQDTPHLKTALQRERLHVNGNIDLVKKKKPAAFYFPAEEQYHRRKRA